MTQPTDQLDERTACPARPHNMIGVVYRRTGRLRARLPYRFDIDELGRRLVRFGSARFDAAALDGITANGIDYLACGIDAVEEQAGTWAVSWSGYAIRRRDADSLSAGQATPAAVTAVREWLSTQAGRVAETASPAQWEQAFTVPDLDGLAEYLRRELADVRARKAFNDLIDEGIVVPVYGGEHGGYEVEYVCPRHLTNSPNHSIPSHRQSRRGTVVGDLVFAGSDCLAGYLVAPAHDRGRTPEAVPADHVLRQSSENRYDPALRRRRYANT